MTLRPHLALLAVVAAVTPLAAMLGLYDTTFEEVARFASPALGAITAIVGHRLLQRRR
jgi:hypothetical protein